MKKVALVIVDVQRDFCTGSLSVPSYVNILNPIKSMLDKKGYWLFYTKDMHTINHCSFKSNGGTWPEHCVIGTDGSEILPEIFKENSRVIIKGTNPNKEEYGATIDRLNYFDEILVCGIAYEYCVYETAVLLKNTYKNIPIKFIEDATAAIDPELAKDKKRRLKSLGIIFITTKDLN